MSSWRGPSSTRTRERSSMRPPAASTPIIRGSRTGASWRTAFKYYKYILASVRLRPCALPFHFTLFPLANVLGSTRIRTCALPFSFALFPLANVLGSFRVLPSEPGPLWDGLDARGWTEGVCLVSARGMKTQISLNPSSHTSPRQTRTSVGA